MKFTQKIQILTGIASTLIILIFIVLLANAVQSMEPRPLDADSFITILSFIFVCSLIGTFGSCYNAVNRSFFTLIILCMGEGVVVIVLGFSALYTFLLGSPLLSLLIISPAILSATTMFLAPLNYLQRR